MSGGIHLTFELQPRGDRARRTERWTVVAQEEVRLGEVRWYAPWRRYTFHPDADMVFDAECLTTLAEFCAKQTQQRKEDRKRERSKS